MEFGLEEKCANYPSLTKPVELTGYHEEVEETRLVSIGNTTNISNLVSQKKLNFQLLD